MASQLEIVDYLKNNYNVQSLDGSVVTLLQSWNDGRSQLVFVSVGEASVVISSPVAQLSQVNLAGLLEVVSETTPYGVRIVGDYVVISNAGLTSTTDAAELAVPISIIAEIADDIEKAVTGGDAL